MLFIGLCVLIIWGLAFVFWPASSVAQTGFATNTPAANQQPPLFATNTPAPMVTRPPNQGGDSQPPLFATNTLVPSPTPIPISPTPAPPDAPFENYALRLWLEQDLLNLLFEQVEALSGAENPQEARTALQLTQYELRRRFPNATGNVANAERLIDAMLVAPRGAVDMRPVVRPYIEGRLNASGLQPQVNTFQGQVRGFGLDIQAANLDGFSPVDALIHIQYPMDATPDTVLYNDYVLARRTESGLFDFFDVGYDLPAAPFDDIEAIQLNRVQDVNLDGVDEVVLRVRDGNVNERLYILSVRNNQVIDLTRPDEAIRFGEIVNWPLATAFDQAAELTVLQYRAESEAPDWPCLSVLPVTWTYTSNFYRPSTDLNARYTIQNSLGCAMRAEEMGNNRAALFGLLPSEAIAIVEANLLEYGLSSPGSDRALMTLAMLYAMNGQLEQARNTAQTVQATSENGSWADRQSNALLRALQNTANTALDICEALVEAAPAPACDINAVIGRYLNLIELRTDDALDVQLAAYSLPVREEVVISEIGRANRTGIQFDIAGSRWWGFVAERDGRYRAEPIETPAEFEPAPSRNAFLQAPASAYEALLVNNNPAQVLNILASLESNNPGTPFTPDALYLRALSFDLVGSRSEARRAYFDLWRIYPRNLWGQLAAAHLERR